MTAVAACDVDLPALDSCTGSGKSSLISALLGDIKKIRGEVEIKGKIAYASQQRRYPGPSTERQ